MNISSKKYSFWHTSDEEANNLIKQFKLYFPKIAANANKYYCGSSFDLIVFLENGDRVLYDNFRKTIKNMPKEDEEIDEAECRNSFGDMLQNILDRKGISRYKLSELTGFDPARISNYVNGKATPNLYSLYKLAKALDCSIDDFIYF